MVFRKENKVDAFQRQISALRQQLGGVNGEGSDDDLYDGGDTAASEEASHAGGRTGAEIHGSSGRQGGRGSDADFESRSGGYGFGGFSISEPADQTGDAMSQGTSMPATLPATPSPAIDAQTSVIAHDTVWKGDLQTNGTLHVHGRVEGSIGAKQDVYVAEEADVDAAITATNVVVAGLVRGTIRCAARFEVLPQGRVAGDVQAPTLVVHDGATVTGQFRMEPAETSEPKAAPVVQRRAARGGA